MKPRSLFPKKHPRQTASVATLDTYWTLTTDQLFARLHTTSNGLQQTDAVAKLPWGISIDAAHRIDIYKDLTQYPLETTRFHPTFAHEMLWNLLAFALIIYLANRLADRLKPGAIFFAWLMLAGLGRFLVEFFRPDQLHLSNSWLSFTQIATIAMTLIGLFMLAFRFGIFKPFMPILPEKYRIAEQSV